jgi:hypothetical protein
VVSTNSGKTACEPYFDAEEATSFWKRGSLRSSSNIRPAGASASSFIEQELARFSNDQRFVYYEHVMAGVMQFDDSRVLHA